MRYAILGLILIIFGLLVFIGMQFAGSVSNRIPAQPTPTVSPAVSISQSADGEEMQQISLYFVALEDNGESGTEIGCGDSLVETKREIPKTPEVLKAALTELLSIQERTIGESRLDNALSQSSLAVDSIEISGETATIYLTGNISLGGVCDAPRVEEQLRATALQFPSIQEVHFYINNIPLEDVLSQRG